MANLKIPTMTGPDTEPQLLRVEIQGAVYQLGLRYNTRCGWWLLDILDATGAALAVGLALHNAGLPANLAVSQRTGLPPGLFLPLAATEGDRDAGLEELGARVTLAYAEGAT